MTSLLIGLPGLPEERFDGVLDPAAISSLVGCGRDLSARVPAQRAGVRRLRALALLVDLVLAGRIDAIGGLADASANY